MNRPPDPTPLPPPPYTAFRQRLLDQADAMARQGDGAAAEGLRAALHQWWEEQRDWTRRVAETLAVHHDINNALVGVRGNAQLLLMAPVGQQPGVRERLEVVLRESGRILEAAGRLRALRTLMQTDENSTSRAA